MPRSGALLPFTAQDQPAGDDVRHPQGDHRAPGDLGCAAARGEDNQRARPLVNVYITMENRHFSLFLWKITIR